MRLMMLIEGKVRGQMSKRYPKTNDLPGYSPEILDRYCRVVLLNRAPLGWSQQRPEQYAIKRFPRNKHRELTDRSLALMLWHHFWLGSLAPPNEMTDRIVIDLDAKGADAVAARTVRYEMIRVLFGVDNRPLVYGTPSGKGLRVAFRIPEIPLATVWTGQNAGFLPEVLRAAGLSTSDGEVELYPQTGRPDRLPLGRRMPILDPDTLAPLPHAAIGDTFSLDALLGGLEEMERWHAEPIDGLLEHLSSLPRLEAEPPATSSQRVATRRSCGTALPPPVDAALLLEQGLTGSSQRKKAEWKLGLAIVRDPTMHGLSDSPADEEVAERVARWLAEKNNGCSDDWNRQLETQKGNVEATVQEFIREYLAPNSDGFHFIDRLWSAATKDDPSWRRVLGVKDSEARSILHVAERSYPAGVLRYRFECWLFAWLRECKRLAYRNRRNGTYRTTQVETRRGTETAVILEISRGRMKNTWPFGSGENQDGTARYVEFREVLYSRHLLFYHEPHRTKGFKGAERNIATRYAVPERIVSTKVRLRDLPADPRDLIRALNGPAFEGKAVTLAEAMHALFIMKTLPIAKERADRYKRASAKKIVQIGKMVSDGLAGLREGGPPDSHAV
jgi:hypothetical protein